MRWFVEISSLGAAAEPPVKLCVEAPQWQPALQKARALRGDEGPLSNFSIELLDEGYRAVDPATRLRYFVRKAPDDAPLTTSMADAVPVAPVAKPEPLADDKPAAATADKQRSRAPMQTSPFGSTGSAAVRPDGEAPPAPPPSRPLPPKKATVQGMPAVSTAPIRKPTVPGMASVSAPASTPPPPRTNTPVPTPAPPRASTSGPTSVPTVVAHKVHTSREENATSSSPLTYREFVYVVAEGTTDEAAKALLFDRLDNLMKTLRNVDGKLVHMAVFDHAYQGRPQRKPIATLKWRDWRGEPEVAFPLREGQPAKETPAKETPQPARPASTPPPAKISVTPLPPRIGVPAAKPSAPAAPLAPKAFVPAPRASTPAPPKASVPPPRLKSADEVMAELSSTVTDLHFLRDALEGADFILSLVGEKFPSEVVLIWLHDADKRELILARQTGGKTDQLLSRISDKAGLAQAALRSQRAVVIPDATRDPRANEARWKALGVEPKSIVVAPVMASGKPYGLIEILNPKTGGRYGTVENNGLTYLGQQLAEFIASKGVIVDSDRILAGAKRIAT